MNKYHFLFFMYMLFAIDVRSQGTSLPASKRICDSLTTILLKVDEDDQKYRLQMNDVLEKFGHNSEQMTLLVRNMNRTDSADFLIVSTIIDKYGWLGERQIGSQANVTLFMVIQHSSLDKQERYLPVMRKAVQEGNAKASDLALLEDRIALRQNRKQIYGSQLSWDMKNNTYSVQPLEDPDNVDKRRASVGLGPLSQYLIECCNLVWDVEKYKRESDTSKNTVFPK